MAEQPLLIIAAGGTGGHMFPARAFADEMIRRGWRVGLISDSRGLKYASDFPASFKREVKAASPNVRKPWTLPGAALKIQAGIGEAARQMQVDRPRLVAGFGGYPAFPALAAARRKKIPLIIHEQNAVLGRVNRQFARYAAFVASGFERLDFMPGGVRHEPVGNPVRGPIRAVHGRPFPAMDDGINILVTGGSQGSQVIGDIVPLAITRFLPPPLLARVKVVQQVRAEQYETVSNIYRHAQVACDLQPFFSDMPERLAASHLVIARSGAGTISELAVVGRPSILIPLAIAMDDHQAANAEGLVEAEAADMLLEANLTPQLLGALIAARLSDPADLAARAAKAASLARMHAAENLADLAEKAARV